MKSNGLNIIGFLDNDENKWNVDIYVDDDKVKVFCPKDVDKKYPVIVTVFSHISKKIISSQLNKLGFKCILLDSLYFNKYKVDIEKIKSWFDDDISKTTYDIIIDARCKNDFSDIIKIYTKDQYFAIPYIEDTNYSIRESFVDAGAFVGDIVEKYIIKRTGCFDYIYAFEPGKIQFNALEERCKRLNREWALDDSRIVCENAALSNENGYLKISTDGENTLGSHISNNGDKIKSYSLDSYLNGRSVGFIKADVEGEELNLLKGAKESIKKYRPKLAISLYHNPMDFIIIPKYIKELVPDYNMSLRHHSLAVEETILYCW